MSSETVPLISKSDARGVYAPSTTSDLRSPCPLVNCLANHGYIARDGRNVHANELQAALNQVGLSTALRTVFAHPIFLEHTDPKSAASKPPTSFWQNLWYLICNPWAILFSGLALRRPGQKDARGKSCLNLDQLALPGAVEHDISLSRRDCTQGDNHSPQPDLIKDILECSSDGGQTLSMEDLSALRRRRIHQQLEVNPGLTYGHLQHEIACVEIALVLKVFGDGQKVRSDYVRAFFQEERLPIQEGWKKRRWWSIGFVELVGTARRVKKAIGIEI